ncbi:lactonase family protein [Wenyingzhuangia sp. IMCC45467]
MKISQLILLFTAITFFGCKNIKTSTKQSEITKFYVGTYTNKTADSHSQGIYQYQLNKNGKIDSLSLVAKTENPSYLTKSFDSKYIIATNSQPNGTITSFLIQENGLKELSSSKANNNPCYITINKDNYILTANYGSGTTVLHQLDQNGLLSEPLDIQKNEITIPSNHTRQNAPHTHSCYFEPNSNNIITIDLGANKLIFGTIDSEFNKIVPNEFSELQMPAKAGPRILTFHPTKPWIYVVNELDATVTFIKKNIANNTYKNAQTIETLAKEDKEGNTAAHIEISNDGNYVYITNRGHDSIGVLKVLESGKLELIQTISTHGKHPRNFALSPNNKFLLVANRDTNNICSFKRNYKTGKLTFISDVKAPKPVCILF